DHDEAEWALRKGGARDEQAEGERVQLALAHHAEGGARDAIDGDVEDHAAAGAVSRELDPSQLHVALLAEALPDARRLFGDGPEAVVADPRRGLLEPSLRGLEALEVRGSAHRLARVRQPAGDGGAHRTPRVFPALELGPRGLSQAKDRLAQGSARRFHVVGEIPEIVDRLRPDPDLQRGDQLSQVQPDLARTLERLPLQDRQLLPSPPRGVGSLVSGLRLLRRFPQARHGRPLPFAPGAIEGELVPADRAVAVA